jgi:transcriptional accessory protein Tex/SPT6
LLKHQEYTCVKKMISNFRPELIVIGDYTISRRIIRQIVRVADAGDSYAEKLSKNIIYATDVAAQLIVKVDQKPVWNNHDTQLSELERINISLGRQQQNMAAELAKLWHADPSKNLFEFLIFDPLQTTLIRKDKLLNRQEELMLEAVGNQGVDLNDILKHTQKSASLLFISGLGFYKAQNMLSTLKYKKNSWPVRKRILLLRFEKNCLQDKVFTNANSFIRIIPPANEAHKYTDYEALDRTRVEYTSIFTILLTNFFRL